ncbi:redoxin family protein [Nemania sp. FL0031]|nr:redoxin family protein [Nemania sp. FL0031]
MTTMALDHSQVPTTIPHPVDDGLASHLLGSSIPTDLTLVSTQEIPIKLSELPGLTILFCYPRTGAPGEAVKEEWNKMPGARGCTAEAGSYRDSFASLKELGVNTIYGLSVQDTAYQKEVKDRLRLPYDILSDYKLEFVKAMKMPVFEWEGATLAKRCTLAIKDSKVLHVWYPVFPPDENASQVVAWLKATAQSG